MPGLPAHLVQELNVGTVTEHVITLLAFLAFPFLMQMQKGKLRCVCVCDSLYLTDYFNSTITISIWIYDSLDHCLNVNQ